MLYRGAFFLKVAAVAVVLAAAAETPVGALTRRGWNRVLAVLLVVVLLGIVPGAGAVRGGFR